ncbi:MAG: glycine cleavage system protein GcvH [Dehalococcoidia bacterium]|nr:glycine cleavage system protein GcvH [Dehalococcoidia bacterium]
MYPEELKYNPEHTWLKMESAGAGRVGITQYAQEQLKQVVFVELPEAGAQVTHMEPFGVIESVKATNDLFAPVSGTVVEVNSALKDEPGLVNEDPYGRGWMIVIRLSNTAELDKLIPASDYTALLKG